MSDSCLVIPQPSPVLVSYRKDFLIETFFTFIKLHCACVCAYVFYMLHCEMMILKIIKYILIIIRNEAQAKKQK